MKKLLADLRSFQWNDERAKIPT